MKWIFLLFLAPMVSKKNHTNTYKLNQNMTSQRHIAHLYLPLYAIPYIERCKRKGISSLYIKSILKTCQVEILRYRLPKHKPITHSFIYFMFIFLSTRATKGGTWSLRNAKKLLFSATITAAFLSRYTFLTYRRCQQKK